MVTLKAEDRDMAVKAKKLRREGYVPCNLIGKEMKESRNLKLNKLEAEMLLKKHKKGAQLVLTIGSEKIPVILKDVSFNPLKKEIELVECQMLVAGEKITATAPIVMVHEENIKEDYNVETDEITYKAFPEDLIEEVIVDFEKVDPTKCVRVSDLDICKNPKLDIVTPANHILINITEHRVVEEPVEEEPTAVTSPEVSKEVKKEE